MAGSTDFTVTADGPTFEDPGSTVDVNDALSGSGQSISITNSDRIIVKPLCPDMFILSAGVTVEGATEVEIMYLDGSGTLLDSFLVNQSIKLSSLHLQVTSYASFDQIFSLYTHKICILT